MRLFFLFFPLFLVLQGCSSKQYFEPNESRFFGFDKKTYTTTAYISTLTAEGATTKDRRVINKNGVSQSQLLDGYEYLAQIDQSILSADKKGNIYISDENLTLNFTNNVIGATKKGSLLALLFGDNSYGIWDIKLGKFLLKEYAPMSYINDTRIAIPIILQNITLFPTLDGKIVIVDNKTFKVTRSIVVDIKNEIKNIILLKTIGDTLIAASNNKIVSLNNGKFSQKELPILNYYVSDEAIYLALLDGSVMVLDFDLAILQNKKYKFAKFHAIALDSKKNIYLVETQGYIVRIASDFSKDEIFSFPFYEDEKIFVSGNKIYYENKLLDLE